MDTITQINDKINHDITLAKRRAKREMTKKGFVNVDGTIMQYNPGAINFVKMDEMQVVDYFNSIIGTSWNTLTPGNIINYLQSELPNFTAKDVEDFTKYITQSQVVINEELIQDLTKKAIADNDLYKNTKADFKGKLNLQSELMVLRNNDIFTDGDFKLFRLKDGKFERYTIHDVLGLFRSTIGTENTKLVMQYVKNHWKSYIDSLTNVKSLLFLLHQKEIKETTMQEAEPGYNEVLKVIASYGGK